MKASATYICPANGIMRFEAPDANLLGSAARVARDLGLEKLCIPVFENSLLVTRRSKVAFLDKLVAALDRVGEAGLAAWMISPCQRLLGVVWPAPYLVTPVMDPGGDPVFLDGQIRFLKAYEWWADPFIIDRRIHWLRDLLSAVKGHPVISGWIILNRELEWGKPDLQSAEFALKAMATEIQEGNEETSLYLGIGLQEFCHPQIVSGLSGQVDGLLISGLEKRLRGLEIAQDRAKEPLVAAYFAALAKWLFKKEVEIEIGWGFSGEPANEGAWFEAGERMASGMLAGINWVSLCDPRSYLDEEPPWVLRERLERASLLSRTLSPKEELEEWLRYIRSVPTPPEGNVLEFVDVSHEEYFADPRTHLSRLWMRFNEGP